MKTFLSFLALASIAFSLLQFNASQNYVLWMLSILATEFAHWFALIPLAGFIACIVLAAKKKVAIPFAVLMTCVFELSIVIFLIPLLQLKLNMPLWNKEFAKVYPRTTQHLQTLPDWGKLWFGALTHKKIELQTIAYAKDLHFDFYPAVSNRPAPWVLVIHGGGWDGGERTQLAELNSRLASIGYAVATMDYRLAPGSTWPAPLEDVAQVIAYLKAHANQLNIDAARGAVLGRSAGGQIAESAAYQLNDPSIKGCIAFYSPADMEFAYMMGKENDIIRSPTLIRNYMGGPPSEKSSAYRNASPILFANKNSPPTLLFHGPRDPLVWVKQSQRLHAKLQESGAKSVLIEIPWATHGFDFNLYGPGGQLSTSAIEIFLHEIFEEG